MKRVLLGHIINMKFKGLFLYEISVVAQQFYKESDEIAGELRRRWKR